MTDEGVFTIPFDDSGEGVEFYTEGWQASPDVFERIEVRRRELEQMARDCTRFLGVLRP